MFQSLRSGKINKKDKKDKVTLTSFPEPNAHDTFINMQRQHGANVYEEQQVLSALKKKYGVTIYKDDSLIDLDENNAGNQKIIAMMMHHQLNRKEKIDECIGWMIIIVNLVIVVVQNLN